MCIRIVYCPYIKTGCPFQVCLLKCFIGFGLLALLVYFWRQLFRWYVRSYTTAEIKLTYFCRNATKEGRNIANEGFVKNAESHLWGWGEGDSAVSLPRLPNCQGVCALPCWRQWLQSQQQDRRLRAGRSMLQRPICKERNSSLLPLWGRKDALIIIDPIVSTVTTTLGHP